MSTVLLVGEDDFLLQTRAAVIRTTGADTLCCSSASALNIQRGRPCDVAILCHSLPTELRNALSSLIHYRWPEARILLLSPIRAQDSPDTVEFVDDVSSTDPERLVQRTVGLLRKGPASEKSFNSFVSICSGL